MISGSTYLTYLWSASIVAVAGGVCDLRTRRIPNSLTLPAVLFGLLLHFALGGWADLGWAFVAMLVAAAIFFVFFLAGGMGGGDVKLMAAVAVIAGGRQGLSIVLATAILGGIYAVALALWKRRLGSTLRNLRTLAVHHSVAGLEPHPEINVANPAGVRLPYGAVIAAGTLAVLATTVGWR